MNIEFLEPVLFAMCDRLPLGVIVTNGDTDNPKTLYINPAFSQNTGYSQKEFLGQNPKILQGKDTSRRVIDRLKYCLIHKDFFIGETFNYTKAGNPYYLQWCISHFECANEVFYFAFQRYSKDHPNSSKFSNQELEELIKQSNAMLIGQYQVFGDLLELIQLAPNDVERETVELVRMRISFLTALSRLKHYLVSNVNTD